MKFTHRYSWVIKPQFQVPFTWLWMISFPLLGASLVVGIYHISLASLLEWWRAHPYVQAYLEAVSVGLLPILFALGSKERLSEYGLQRAKTIRSTILSLLVVAAFYSKSFLTTGEWISHTSFPTGIPFPWNIWHAAWGIFANGHWRYFISSG